MLTLNKNAHSGSTSFFANKKHSGASPAGSVQQFIQTKQNEQALLAATIQAIKAALKENYSHVFRGTNDERVYASRFYQTQGRKVVESSLQMALDIITTNSQQAKNPEQFAQQVIDTLRNTPPPHSNVEHGLVHHVVPGLELAFEQAAIVSHTLSVNNYSK